MITRFDFACKAIQKIANGNELFFHHKMNNVSYFHLCKGRVLPIICKYIENFRYPCEVDNEDLEEQLDDDQIYDMEKAYNLSELTKQKQSGSTSNCDMPSNELAELFLDTLQKEGKEEDLFWLKHHNKFSPIFKMLLQNRAIFATSSDTESLFSKVTCMVPDDRHSTDVASLIQMVKIRSFEVTNEMIFDCVKEKMRAEKVPANIDISSHLNTYIEGNICNSNSSFESTTTLL